jgi:hypothetical protein
VPNAIALKPGERLFISNKFLILGQSNLQSTILLD